MQVPLQIAFDGVNHSDAVAARITESTAKLEQFSDRITSCRVVVQKRHKRHHKGGLYHVQIKIGVPGQQLIVGRNPAEHGAHEDIYVAIRDSFDEAQRQLQDWINRQRGKTKAHETPPHGTVAKLFAGKDYGIIKSSDGQEIYFHRNSVVGDGFDRLTVGSEVRFIASPGDKGPQATTVHLVGKHHIVA